jgi:hypothetical protein
LPQRREVFLAETIASDRFTENTEWNCRHVTVGECCKSELKLTIALMNMFGVYFARYPLNRLEIPGSESIHNLNSENLPGSSPYFGDCTPK